MFGSRIVVVARSKIGSASWGSFENRCLGACSQGRVAWKLAFSSSIEVAAALDKWWVIDGTVKMSSCSIKHRPNRSLIHVYKRRSLGLFGCLTRPPERTAHDILVGLVSRTIAPSRIDGRGPRRGCSRGIPAGSLASRSSRPWRHQLRNTLVEMQRFKEARKLMRKTMPVVRLDDCTCDVTEENRRWTFTRRRQGPAPSATLDDLRKAVTMLAETQRTTGARRGA